eukprot:COSAG04_NODE_5821_length_1484_cov_1.272924_2_plen_112_part_00
MRAADDLKSLIRGMLTVDPERRLTIVQIRARKMFVDWYWSACMRVADLGSLHPDNWVGVLDAEAEEDTPVALDWAAAPEAIGSPSAIGSPLSMWSETSFEDSWKNSSDEDL